MAVKIEILQGAREIGGTCIALIGPRTTILLDIGLPLRDLEDDYSPPVLPENIAAVLVSHYHRDHWGLMDLLPPATPVYMPAKGRDLLILQEKLLGREKTATLPDALPFSPGDILTLGEMKIITHPVDHSAMDACAFEIECEGERIVYTGDFRSHGRKGTLWNRFIRTIGRPVDTLICEGTMLSREGRPIPTEKDLEQRCLKTLKEHENGLALGWCSTVNFDRITTFYRAARQVRRAFAVDIFAAHMLRKAAEGNRLPDPLDFDDIRVYYPPAISRMLKDSEGVEILYPFARKKLDRREVEKNPGEYLILVRPSLEFRWLDTITRWEDSVLFYSQWSGYRDIPKNRDFLKKLKQRGCRDVTLHTSGHADAETLRKTIEALQPKNVLPVHTENPEWFGEQGIRS